MQLWAVGVSLKVMATDAEEIRISKAAAGLLAFLYDGRVEIDTNFVENRIRPVKLTAKNALFAGHDEGAAAWGRVASLIETCKMNGVEPYAWLKSTLEKTAAGHPQSRIHELLPRMGSPDPVRDAGRETHPGREGELLPPLRRRARPGGRAGNPVVGA